jgi:hypothetical protein
LVLYLFKYLFCICILFTKCFYFLFSQKSQVFINFNFKVYLKYSAMLERKKKTILWFPRSVYFPLKTNVQKLFLPQSKCNNFNNSLLFFPFDYKSLTDWFKKLPFQFVKILLHQIAGWKKNLNIWLEIEKGLSANERLIPNTKRVWMTTRAMQKGNFEDPLLDLLVSTGIFLIMFR